jgi:hypothetical protein
MMPAHISHSLFALDLLEGLELCRDDGDRSRASALHLGAQGPDIFFHNQRRMPSGLLIGSVLHRKGYGSVAARMFEYCLTRGLDSRSPEGRYLLGFISHGILDRFLHPYINYFGGWVDKDDPDSEAYRYCHPFLERILDLAFAVRAMDRELLPAAGAHAGGPGEPTWESRYDETEMADQPLNFFDFAGKFDAGEKMPGEIPGMLMFALRGSYHRMSSDEKLPDRIANAYADSRGFYHYCQGPRDRNIPVKWAALLHPPRLPANLDFTNVTGSGWLDPCDENLASNASAYDLYDAALEEALRVAAPVKNILDGGDPPPDYPGLPEELGDHGLRNNIPGPDADLPCALTHCDPLPLRSMLEIVASGDYPDGWVDWISRFRST